MRVNKMFAPPPPNAQQGLSHASPTSHPERHELWYNAASDTPQPDPQALAADMDLVRLRTPITETITDDATLATQLRAHKKASEYLQPALRVGMTGSQPQARSHSHGCPYCPDNPRRHRAPKGGSP
jgi:hypothetical protein